MPRSAPLSRSSEPGVESAPPRSTPAMIGLAADPVIGLAEPVGNDRVLVHRDQPYGSEGHPQQRFDLHLPDGCSGGGLPLVVWIHGPDWRSGSKSDCPIVWLASQGYAVASIGYRTSDVAVFPAQLDDCRTAIDSVVADASTWGIDPTRVCVAGSVAGGHLAALIAFVPVGAGPIREAAAEALAGSATVPAAVAIVGAPVSLTTLGPASDRAGSPASRLVGGPVPEFREAAQRASPLAHVSADDPPSLIVHAISDPAVPAAQAALLDKALTAAGVDSTLVLLDDSAGHASLAAGSPAAIALVEFLDRVIGPGIKGPRE
ncbi:MAG: alpha/beta hydrolase fold domain-containing protein [Pirellulales bacterium]